MKIIEYVKGFKWKGNIKLAKESYDSFINGFVKDGLGFVYVFGGFDW